MQLDDGDEIVKSWIDSGRYLPTRDDCERMPWMAKAYTDLLYRLCGGNYGTFCEVCNRDDTHREDCYVSNAAMKVS